jgi:endonuclease G
MKYVNIFALALVFWSCTTEPTFSQQLRESVIVQTDIFKVEYSETLEQPLWVEYKVLCPNGDADRGGMDFYTVDGIHTSDNGDYSNNEWDKGHMAPAAAFNCDKETLKKTFSYLNSALQHESLNRGIWNRLEGFERNLANFYEVSVRIDVIFDETPKRVPGGAAIPKGFIKIIKWGDKTVKFNFPNSNTKGTDWIDYLVK